MGYLEPPQRCSNQVGSDLICEYWTWLETFVRDKHSSLFGFLVSDKEKNLITLIAGVNIINIFVFTIDHRYLRKIDCSSFVMCLLLALVLPRIFLQQTQTRQIRQTV
jgi:hypothetical protein